MQNQKVVVDPPSGWRYGFPKVYNPEQDGMMKDWLVKNGYPIKDVEFALNHLRVWNAE